MKHKVIEMLRKGTISKEHTDCNPAFFEMTMKGFTKPFNERLFSYSLSFSYFKNHELFYLSLVEEQDAMGKNTLDVYMKNKEWFLDAYNKWVEQNYKGMYDYFYVNQIIELDSLSDNELVELSNELHEFYEKRVTMPGFIDGFSFYAERVFPSMLEKLKNNGIELSVNEQVHLLTHTRPSFLFEEKKDLKKLNSMLRECGWKGSKLKEFLKQHRECLTYVNEHLTKWSWVLSSYIGHKQYGIEELEKRLVGIENFDEHEVTKNKEIKEEIIQKYGLDKYKDFISLIELIDLLGKWQDQRKEYTLTFVTLKTRILKEVSLRKGIPYELIVYSLNHELRDVMNGKLTQEKLKARLNGFGILTYKSKYVALIEGDEASKLFEELTKVDIRTTNEIRGTVASKGYARGIVKVVFNVNDLSKVNPGDIIVCTMTRPEYVPAIKKCSGIITDEGGLTSHAAIISREFKKPCIIGTKVATSLLKDGMKVELDTHKGVVRILK